MRRERLGGGNPVFAPGEAEELVRELRAQLRLERERRRRYEPEGAVRARARATALLRELGRRHEQRVVR